MKSLHVLLLVEEPGLRSDLAGILETAGHSVHLGDLDHLQGAVYDAVFEEAGDAAGDGTEQRAFYTMAESFHDRTAVIGVGAFHRERLAETPLETAWVCPPLSGDQVLASLELAVRLRKEIVALCEKSTDLKERLETRQAMERAKLLLMTAHGLNESDAFRRIQRQSMNSRRSMKEVAQEIILVYFERAASADKTKKEGEA